jgi:hypothetical protein
MTITPAADFKARVLANRLALHALADDDERDAMDARQLAHRLYMSPTPSTRDIIDAFCAIHRLATLLEMDADRIRREFPVPDVSLSA